MAGTVSEVKTIALGSGDIFVKEVSGTIDTSDVDTLITSYFIDANRYGDTKNGGTLTYTPTTYTVKDDLGRINETFITADEAKLAFGSLTIGNNILASMIPTARLEVTTKGLQVLKIGGIKNDDKKNYFVGFKHTSKIKGTIYVILVGKNTGEISLPFAPESETIFNPTITAKAMDASGTKVILAFEGMDGMKASA